MTLATSQPTISMKTLKANIVYAKELVESTSKEYKDVKYFLERSLQRLGGSYGVVAGRDSNDELVRLVEIKTERDFKLALDYVSEYIMTVDNKTMSMAPNRVQTVYEVLGYFQENLARFRRLMVSRALCKKFIHTVNKVREQGEVVNSVIYKYITGFSPDMVEDTGIREHKRVEGVLRNALRGFQKARLRTLKDEDYELLEEMTECINFAYERGFELELNDWDRDMPEFISSLYKFANNYVEDGRVSLGLKNRVDRLYDLHQTRLTLREEIKEHEKQLKEFDNQLIESGYEVVEIF